MCKQRKHAALVGWWSKLLTDYKITAFWMGYSVVCHFIEPHYWTIFLRTKVDALLMLILCGMKRYWKLFFFNIKEMLSCPEINLVSTGSDHSTRYQFDYSVFKTKIWRSSHRMAYHVHVATSEPDLTPCDLFLWEHLKADVFLTPVPDLLTLKNWLRVEIGKFWKETL